MEPDGPVAICWQYHRPGWIRRAEGYSFDGALRLCPKSTVAGRHHGTQPVFRCESRSLRRARIERYCFGYQIQRHDEIQLIASRGAEADESRFAVSGRLYVLQVHVRQHRLLRSMGQCSECLGILAERLRPEVGVCSVLL